MENRMNELLESFPTVQLTRRSEKKLRDGVYKVYYQNKVVATIRSLYTTKDTYVVSMSSGGLPCRCETLKAARMYVMNYILS